MLNHPIQNQIDLILFEEGSFSPLSWLLREGYIDYNDYLNWKNGTSKFLEDHFKESITILMTALKEAEEYARLLKLEPGRQTYSSIDNRSLHFCRCAEYELIFTTVYEPAHDRIQMDLFFDSADSCAVANVISAIVESRSDEIPDLVAKLEVLNPDKCMKFNELLGYDKKITQANIASDKKIELILQKITPLAFELLGRFTLDFLTPLWCELSVEVADQHFDAEIPQKHLSFTAFKEFQWQRVLSCIEREADWNRQPLLIFRYAESCFKLNKEREGINNWFRLFIQFPEDAEQLINDCCNRLMISDWQKFSELDPELESTLFPAWMLMNRPAFAQNMAISGMTSNEPLQLVEKLVSNAGEVINEVSIRDRVRLRECSPSLFSHYMRMHSTVSIK